MGYLGYYLAWALLSYGLRQPWLLAGLVVLWLLRGLIPGPRALFGSLGRASRLREQVKVNRANITARRDLATIYLDLLRPRRALELLDEGLSLAPDDAELLYLSGLALHRAKQHEPALERLLRAIDKDERLRHGEPYLAAGDALLALGRWDDAIDGYERFLDFNSSHVGVHTQLARAQAGAGHTEASRSALLTGIETWHSLPGSMKRRQFGAYLRAEWARITVLKDWRAISVLAAALALLTFGAAVGYPLLVAWFRPSDTADEGVQRFERSFARCGSQRTGDFAGEYEVSGDGAEHFSDFKVLSDRIIAGGERRQEFCLTKVLTRKPDFLRAEAIYSWHPTAPGARMLIQIWLSRSPSGVVTFDQALLGDPVSARTLTLHRKP